MASRSSTSPTCCWSPDPATAVVDPFVDGTVTVIATVRDPITSESYSRDPRNVALKAEAYLRQSGVGDVSYWGPEAEFFVFDTARFEQTANRAFYEVDSEEGIWRSGEAFTLDGTGRNLGMKPRHKEGYFPADPVDTFTNMRNEMVREMQKFGMVIEKHHHEVATAGQGEIDIRFDELVKTADAIMAYKYVVKNVARRHGKVATFMAKPLFGDNGTGMHCHQSIWKDGVPLFAGDEYAGLSEMALHYVGGLIAHGSALMALLAPTSNSYKRLVPGFEAADHPRDVRSEPKRRCPRSHVLPEPQGQAHRVPAAGPQLQPLPRLRCDAHGRLGRRRTQALPRRPAGRQPLRAAGG